MPLLERTTAVFLKDDLGRGRQNWHRETTVRLCGLKVRTVIERDSYDFQSRIRSEVWNRQALAWSVVESRSGTDYPDLPSAYEKDDVKIIAGSNELMNDMLRYAETILEES